MTKEFAVAILSKARAGEKIRRIVLKDGRTFDGTTIISLRKPNIGNIIIKSKEGDFEYFEAEEIMRITQYGNSPLHEE